jgi:tetratricopeptide (TPR) repeat protein
VYATVSALALRANEIARARATWEKADALFDRVAQIARSDDAVYGDWSRWLVDRGSDLEERNLDSAPVLERALEMCERGRAASSEAWWPDSIVSNAELHLAQLAGRTHGDLLVHVERAISAAQRSVEQHPERWTGWKALGDACETKADWWDKPHGIDPRPSLRRAIAAYDRALRLFASDPPLFYCAALAQVTLVEWEIEHGGDFTPPLEAALNGFESAIRIELRVPGGTPAAQTACFVLAAAAQATLERGRDPRPLLDRAEPLCKVARERDVSHPFNFSHWAYVEWVRALHARATGGDPLPPLSHAIEDVETASKLPGAEATTFAIGSRVLVTRAEIATARKEDPGPWLARARSAAEKALALDDDASSVASFDALASVELADARARLLDGRDARAQLAAAARAADSALAKRADDLAALVMGAEIRALAKQPHDGLALVARALAVNPRAARAFAVRAVLQRLAGDAGAAEASQAQALSLDALLAADPLLATH